jgi:hypothetical protein
MSQPSQKITEPLFICTKKHSQEDIISRFDYRSMDFNERDIFTEFKKTGFFFKTIEDRLFIKGTQPVKECPEPGPPSPPPPSPEDRADRLKAALADAFATALPADGAALGRVIKAALGRIGYPSWALDEVSLVVGPVLYGWCRNALTPLHNEDGAVLPPPYPAGLPDHERIVGRLGEMEVWASALTLVPQLRYPDPKEMVVLVVTLPGLLWSPAP